MDPSQAKVFSSGFSGLSSSKHKNVSYRRLNSSEDALEYSTVNFQRQRTSFCAKLCFGLLALMLLTATLATSVLIMNFKSFTVEVQPKKGNTLVYKFDQEITICGSEKTHRNTTAIVSMHVINRTEGECWFGVVLSFPNAKRITKSQFSRDVAFLVHVNNVEQTKYDGSPKHFKVFGNPTNGREFSLYVYNVLNQLLPFIKVKLYEFVLSKVSSSSRNTVVDNHRFFPGRVHVRQTMITTRNSVIVTTTANPDNFESFGGRSVEASWELKYDETTVVNKKTGMIKRGDMFISGMIPLGTDFEAGTDQEQRNLTVTFKSVVKLLDENPTTLTDWKSVAKNEKSMTHPISPPSSSQMKVSYFAPLKKRRGAKTATDLSELLKLAKTSAGRSKKLPSMIKIVRGKSRNSVTGGEFSDVDYEDDDDDDEDDNDDSDARRWSNHSENPDGDDDDEEDYVPSWPMPNFIPFGYGYNTVKKKRAITGEFQRARVSFRKVNGKATNYRSLDLDPIWDELRASTPEPIPNTPRIIQTSFLGLPVLAEILYGVRVQEREDEENQEDWALTTSFLLGVAQYRAAAFKRVHRLKSLRKKLPHKGQHKISRWTVRAGDFVLCAQLFFIQRLCAELRLTFDVTVSYRVSRFSSSYPVNLDVHIEQTVTTNATLAAHSSTWLLDGGLYTRGTVAVARLPVGLSFNEDSTPEWCTNTDLEQKVVRIDSVQFSSWRCKKNLVKMINSCKGLLPPSNGSSSNHSLQFTSVTGAMFENWHYPINCVHRRGQSAYDNHR